MSENVTCCGHNRTLFLPDKRSKAIAKIIDLLEDHIHEFDAIAVSGYSMALISPIIANFLNKEIVLVRKKSENRNSDYEVEGIHGQRCVLVDDLIASGRTFEYIREEIRAIDCSLVGFVLYHDSYDYKKGYGNIPCFGSFSF